MPKPGYLPGHRVHTHTVTVTDAAIHAACGATGAAYPSATEIGTVTRTVTTTAEKG